MANWTATTTTKATPDQILEVLTHPEEIRRWSPIDFDVDELGAARLAAGTRARVTGKVAGVRVGFDVEVHSADSRLLELSADGPVGLDVRYELAPADAGAEVSASVSLRRGGGLTGRVVANATAALLSAGVLDGAADRIARAAERQPELALAA
jgi:Polyketide cyclase / dehydrase and lipid transport